jgi:exodeoxyribonuclease VII large subunit
VARERAALIALRTRPSIADPHVLVQYRRDDVVRLRDRARRCFDARVRRAVDDLVHVRARVTALSPAATLERGYAVVQKPDGAVVRRPDQVQPGDQLRLRLAAGELGATAAS